MTSAPVRDPLADHLLTPANAAFLFVEHEPAQLVSVCSMDRAPLLSHGTSGCGNHERKEP
jgi:hypothetical protein